MAQTKISALVEGGKASAGAPLGPAMGPMGVNIGDVVAKINEKTKEFAGMKVPVTVIVDSATKEFEIEVGSPPVSALIKKRIGLDKGSGEAGKTIVKDMSLADAIAVAKMKLDSLFSLSLKAATKEVLGSCVSMGLTVEGKDPREIQKLIDEGDYDSQLVD